MELVEKYPCRYLAKRRILLNDDDFEMEYNSLVVRHKKKFKYEDMKPCFGTGSMAEAGWGPLGGWVFFFGLIFCIITLETEVQAIKFAGILVFLVSILAALVFFVIRFIKHECVYIYDKNDDTITHIRITDASKDFIEEFQKRVELANKNKM